MMVQQPSGQHGTSSYTARWFRLPDVTLHGVEAGPQSGPLIILLHGFPEFWWAWRHYLDRLAEEGLRVLAPDQRGYNLSSKPVGIAAYSLDKLAADVVGLITASKRERATLVGHDWGGIVASWAAVRYPSRVEKLVLINAPHWPAASRYIRRQPAQMLKSAYAGFFQLPVLPEILLRRRNYAALVNSMIRSSRPDTFTENDFAEYRRAWSQPDALHSMLNWYRALVRNGPESNDGQIRAPTLLLWGRQDAFLQPGIADATLAKCSNGGVFWFEEATHWVHHEQVEALSKNIIEFVRNT